MMTADMARLSETCPSGSNSALRSTPLSFSSQPRAVRKKLSCFRHTAICSKGWKQKADRLNPLHGISVINSEKKACRSVCLCACCPLPFRIFPQCQLGLRETRCYTSIYLHLCLQLCDHHDSLGEIKYEMP